MYDRVYVAGPMAVFGRNANISFINPQVSDGALFVSDDSRIGLS